MVDYSDFCKNFAGGKSCGQPRFQAFLVLLLIISITLLHYLTSLSLHAYHDIYRRLYYIPIILAAFWFGLRGGLFVSVLISLVYAPHAIMSKGEHSGSLIDNFLEIFLFNIIALITGALIKIKNRETAAKDEVTQQLKKSYDELNLKTRQLMKMENNLRRADRLSTVGELAASVAHEIRNPLNSIQESIDILRRNSLDQENKNKFLDILSKESTRLNIFLSDFLKYSRSGQCDLKKSRVAPVLDSTLTLLGSALEAKNVEIKREYSNEGVEAVFDEDQIRQVFLNILLNAIRAVGENGKIFLRVYNENGTARVEIGDNGEGISSGNLGRLFDPFYTTRADGTGLGLSISKTIMKRNKGNISVRSDTGKGTVFTLSW